MLEIYPFPTRIQLTFFIGGIQYYVIVVGKWILTAMFRLRFLSLINGWTNVVQIMMKQK